ncbi:MAG: type III pantothenate kinase [Cytophagales bacterium]|nr:type III pantothenate kinase [Cytophagales bacterium]
MDLVLDFGNTSIKVACFEQDELTDFFVCHELIPIYELVQNKEPSQIIISSVTKQHLPLLSFKNVQVLNHDTPLPITNEYQTPKTLGVDRLAGVIGAMSLFPQTNCLVIDAGTCITYDFLTKDKKYLGGSISLGSQMRFKALHNFTNALPLEELDLDVDLIGTSTKTAIQSGVFHGMAHEINGVIQAYEKQFGKVQTIICGGDAKYFESMIKAPIFADSNLVLRGLHTILRYNVSVQ